MPVVTKKSYTIYLPLADNDGNPFEESEFLGVALQLTAKFGGTTHMQPTREVAYLGTWMEPGITELYRDKVITFFVLADASSETETFFVNLKRMLIERFKQKDILLLAYLVEVY